MDKYEWCSWGNSNHNYWYIRDRELSQSVAFGRPGIWALWEQEEASPMSELVGVYFIRVLCGGRSQYRVADTVY